MSTGQNRELPSFLVASVSLFALAGGHWIQLDSDPTCRSSHRRFLCAGSHATCRCHRAQVPDGNVISLTCLPSAVHRGSCKRSLRVIDAAADAAQRLRNEQHGHFQYAQGRAPQQFLHALRNLSCELPHRVQCACAADKPMLTPASRAIRTAHANQARHACLYASRMPPRKTSFAARCMHQMKHVCPVPTAAVNARTCTMRAGQHEAHQ